MEANPLRADADDELRRLHDALTTGGAMPNALGRLVLTKSQLAFMRSSTNVFDLRGVITPETPSYFQALTEITPEIAAWLDTPIKTMITGDQTAANHVQTRTFNLLEKSGLNSARNLLIAGSLSAEAIRNYGPNCRAEAETALNKNSFGITLQAKPTLAELVLLCTDLKLVTVGAAISPLHDFRRLSLQRVVSATSEELISRYLASEYRYANLSVNDKMRRYRQTISRIATLKAEVNTFTERILRPS